MYDVRGHEWSSFKVYFIIILCLSIKTWNYESLFNTYQNNRLNQITNNISKFSKHQKGGDENCINGIAWYRLLVLMFLSICVYLLFDYSRYQFAYMCYFLFTYLYFVCYFIIHMFVIHSHLNCIMSPSAI